MNIDNPNKKYYKKNNLTYSCQYHVIFCSKYRRKVLIDGVDEELKNIILDNQEKYDYNIIEIEIIPDHVHLLIEINPKIGVFSTVCKIKGISSKMIREKFMWIKKRIPTLWTHSSFISSVGSVSLDVVEKYIENQKTV
jgi:putative transposase